MYKISCIQGCLIFRYISLLDYMSSIEIKKINGKLCKTIDVDDVAGYCLELFNKPQILLIISCMYVEDLQVL